MAEILISNMSLSPLAWFPLEVTGLVARVLGFDGVEYVPTFEGGVQSATRIVTPMARIKSGHWSWRGQSYSPFSLIPAIKNFKKAPGEFVAALATYITMPDKHSSEKYLTSMQQALKRDDLPVVIYTKALAGKKPQELPFKNKTVQITPDLLKDHKINSLSQLQDQLALWMVGACYDGIHSSSLPDDIKKYVISNATEVHLRNGADLGIKTKTDVGILKDCVSVERIVVETQDPRVIMRTLRQVREIVG